jgi:hypothetical protein
VVIIAGVIGAIGVIVAALIGSDVINISTGGALALPRMLASRRDRTERQARQRRCWKMSEDVLVLH